MIDEYTRHFTHAQPTKEVLASSQEFENEAVALAAKIFGRWTSACLGDAGIAAVEEYCIDKEAVEYARAIRSLVLPQANSVMDAIALAYGYLWHVNNEPMAPIPLYSPEKAAYEARRVLRDLMTHEQRGVAIAKVQALLSVKQ